MKRRVFTFKILMGAGFFLALGCASTPFPDTTSSGQAYVQGEFVPKTTDYGSGAQPMSILQAATGYDSTEILILTPKRARFTYLLVDTRQHKKQASRPPERFTREHSDWAVDQIVFTQLKPDRMYRFEVWNEAKKLVDERELQTLNPKTRKLRFAFFSCMDDAPDYEASRKQIWPELISQRPDVLFFIGDNVYADRRVNFYQGPANAGQIWDRYVETRFLLPIFHEKKLIPSFAVWDDHDYGQNNGNQTFRDRPGVTMTFHDFFGRHSVPRLYERGPGVSSWLMLAGQGFVFLDNRSFRTPVDNYAGAQSHLGTEQTTWLTEKLQAWKGPVWLIKGDQYFGGYHQFESFAGSHPVDFQNFLALIKSNPNPVVFLSGDRHNTELMKIPVSVLGYETYELTTSPLHAKTFPDPWGQVPNPLQIHGAAERHNYAVIESEVRQNKSTKALRAQLAVFTLGKTKLYEKTIEVRK